MAQLTDWPAIPDISHHADHLLKVFDEVPLDDTEIPQHALDLERRDRSSLFSWRGQFSPQLIELLISHYATQGDLLLDPFAGVGTTLFEGARQGFSCVGAELNPAAVAMAETLLFMRMCHHEREQHFRRSRELLDESLEDSFVFAADRRHQTEAPAPVIVDLIQRNARDKPLRNILMNTLIRLLRTEPHDEATLFRTLDQHQCVVTGLPHSETHCRVFHGDARRLPLQPACVDLVITSPPYINVFNYHQNDRAAMELVGWDVLTVAQSEFGSNRKHRGNRFLTVIQYCLDIAAAFGELKRVLRPGARCIIVVGRESNVRGVRFENGRLAAALGVLAGFQLIQRQERKFTNKFGGLIFEDLLHFSPVDESDERPVAISDARAIASTCLKEVLRTAGAHVVQDIRAALEGARHVQPSPMFHPERAIRR